MADEKKKTFEENQKLLKAHIDRLNGNNRDFRLSDNLDNWANDYGITTPQQLDDYLDMEAYVNFYKDEYGQKPSKTSIEGARKFLKQYSAEKQKSSEKEDPIVRRIHELKERDNQRAREQDRGKGDRSR